jgi:hypothetical protein
MSCDEMNPCDPCSQHDNCGCVNPNTFGCTTYTGLPLPCLDIANAEDGTSILSKIEDKICNIGKVKLDENDLCPEGLFEKLTEGLNISLTQVGTGCDRKIRIDATQGGVAVDVNVKVSSNDTTSGKLNDKIQTGVHLVKTITTPAGNEKLKLDVVPSTLISNDAGNQLTLGADGKLSTAYTAPDGSETKVVQGTGVTVTGNGTTTTPYIISTNPSIQVVRPCFDSVWRNVTLVTSGNASAAYASGAPQYRYRHDGSVEFKGSITYTVKFGTYNSTARKFTIPMGNIPLTCLTLTELGGVMDLKAINYIEPPAAATDQITQQFGYIIRRSAQNLILEFQSSYINATDKSIVVNFEGVVIHPNI